MSHWFTIRLRPAVGSLAAATTALAAADVAIVGIVGSAESDDGVVHLAVEPSARERATAALHTAGIDVVDEPESDTGARATEGMIEALLHGPRT